MLRKITTNTSNVLMIDFFKIPAARFSTFSWLGNKAKPIMLNPFHVLQAKFLNDEQCREKGITPEALFNRANKFLKEPGFWNNHQANKALNRMLRFSPTLLEVDLYERTGDVVKSRHKDSYAFAHRFYVTAYNHGLTSNSILIKLGQGYLADKNFPQAMKFFNFAKNINPTSPVPYNWLGITYIVEGCHLESYDKLEEHKKHAEIYFSAALKFTYSEGVQENIIVANALYPALYRWLPSSDEFIFSETDRLVSLTHSVLKALEYGKTSTQTDTSTLPAITSSGDVVMGSVRIEVPNPDVFATIRRIHRKIGFFYSRLQDSKNRAFSDTTALLQKLVKETPEESTDKVMALKFLVTTFSNYQKKGTSIPAAAVFEAVKVDSKLMGFPIICALIKLGMPITEANSGCIKDLGIKLDDLQLETIKLSLRRT